MKRLGDTEAGLKKVLLIKKRTVGTSGQNWFIEMRAYIAH